MLGSTLIFAGLFTYGVHSTKAMARADAHAKAQMAGQANDLDLDLDVAVEGSSSAYASPDGEFASVRRVKSMVGLRRGGWNGNSTAVEKAGRGFLGNKAGEEDVVKFREVCYEMKERETLKIEMEMPGLMKGGRGIALDMS